jgi:hypothetical protein
VEVELLSFLASELDGGQLSTSSPSGLTPNGKESVPLKIRRYGSQSWYKLLEKINLLLLTGFETRTVRFYNSFSNNRLSQHIFIERVSEVREEKQADIHVSLIFVRI